MPPSASCGIVKREHFIRKFVDAGFTYAKAEQAYEAVMSLVEDAVSQRQSVVFRSVGKLEPHTLGPRTVMMGMNNTGGVMRRDRKVFVLGQRTRFVFKVFRAFGVQHGLRV